MTMLVKVRNEADVEAAEKPVALANVQYQHADFDGETAAEPGEAEADAMPAQPFEREGAKIGRNDPCPCGSGKKYKQCHGKLS